MKQKNILLALAGIVTTLIVSLPIITIWWADIFYIKIVFTISSIGGTCLLCYVSLMNNSYMTHLIDRDSALRAMDELKINIASNEENYKTIAILKAYLSVIDEAKKSISSLPTHEDRVKEVIEKNIAENKSTWYADETREAILEELLNELYPNN